MCEEKLNFEMFYMCPIMMYDCKVVSIYDFEWHIYAEANKKCPQN